MEEKGVNSCGVTVIGNNEAPESYRIAARNETSIEFSGSIIGGVTEAGTALVSVVGGAGSTEEKTKKKRGRPRKYRPDGSVATALSPMPISASIPLTGDFSAWKQTGNRPVDSVKKKQKFELETPGERVAYSIGANFTPHVITVNSGEDVTMKIISFAQQGSRAICVLAANGAISNVTLRQPNSSGGTLTYEGRFEILSLTGSFMPSDNGLTKSRSGGMSVSLSGPDGRVMGGGLAGMLVAAGPIQVVLGSFLTGHQQEQKPKKQKFEHAPTFAAIPAPPISDERTHAAYTMPNSNLASSTPFPGDKLISMNSIHSSRISSAENNISFAGEISKEQSPSS